VTPATAPGFGLGQNGCQTRHQTERHKMTKNELRLGMVIYHGGAEGTVTGFSGLHGVRVDRMKHWTDQDFLTGRLTPRSALVSQVWPIRSVTRSVTKEREEERGGR
jgi:hypothetical protein